MTIGIGGASVLHSELWDSWGSCWAFCGCASTGIKPGELSQLLLLLAYILLIGRWLVGWLEANWLGAEGYCYGVIILFLQYLSARLRYKALPQSYQSRMTLLCIQTSDWAWSLGSCLC